MRYTLLAAIFTALFGVSIVAFAAPVSQFDVAQERARQNFETAMARIAAESKADQAECSQHTGPAAEACAIQAEGKRSAAEEAAKLALAHAREQPPTSMDDPEKAAEAGKRKAKVEYGVAKARIRNNRNRANAQCSKLKAEEDQHCKKQVNARYVKANETAASVYARALATAQSMAIR